MDALLSHKFIKTAVVLLVAGLASFYALSIVTMQHSQGMEVTTSNCLHFDDGMDSMPVSDSNACVTYHLGLLHDLSQAASASLGLQLVMASFVVFSLSFLSSLTTFLQLFFVRLKERCRHLHEETVFAFFETLGFWLAIVNKKDFAHAPAIA